MKDFLQSLFKTTEERIKNPFIGAFITSWTLFNWKPMLFLIFSSKIIEDKIKYIDENFTSLEYVLLFPLLASAFYVLILPYLSLIIDILVEKSIKTRSVMLINSKIRSIEEEKQLAIAEIGLEEAKTEFRERKTHNKFIEDLQKQNIDLQSEIEAIKSQSSEIIDKLKLDFEKMEKVNVEDLEKMRLVYNDMRDNSRKLLNKSQDDERKIQELELELSRIKMNDKVLVFENGVKVREEKRGDSKVYYDETSNLRVSHDYVKSLIDKYKYSIYYKSI